MKTIKKYGKYIPEKPCLTENELLEIYVALLMTVKNNAKDKRKHPYLYENNIFHKYARSAFRKITNLYLYHMY